MWWLSLLNGSTRIPFRIHGIHYTHCPAYSLGIMHSRIQDVDPPILSSFSVRQDGIRTHTLALASHFSYVSAGGVFYFPLPLREFLRLSVHHICMRSSDTQSLPSSTPLSLPPGIPHLIDGMGGR